MSSLQQIHSQLNSEFISPNRDLKKVGSLLTKSKIALTEAGLLIPSSNADRQSLLIARETLEIGAYYSIQVRDVPAFERYVSQLNVYYNDLGPLLPPSPHQSPLLGLHLLSLLSSTPSRISDFHTLLETLPADVIRDNPYVQYPVSLERWLMEGSYGKVWKARQESSAAASGRGDTAAGRELAREEERFFVDRLLGTIRNEIASCEENAYDSLPLADAATLLFFNTLPEVLDFAQQRGWQIHPTEQRIYFPAKADVANPKSPTTPSDAAATPFTSSKTGIPKEKIITASLGYARALEEIV